MCCKYDKLVCSHLTINFKYWVQQSPVTLIKSCCDYSIMIKLLFSDLIVLSKKEGQDIVKKIVIIIPIIVSIKKQLQKNTPWVNS